MFERDCFAAFAIIQLRALSDKNLAIRRRLTKRCRIRLRRKASGREKRFKVTKKLRKRLMTAKRAGEE
jgi:hypothetical protein